MHISIRISGMLIADRSRFCIAQSTGALEYTDCIFAEG